MVLVELIIFLSLAGISFMAIEAIIAGFGIFGIIGVICIIISSIITILVIPMGGYIVVFEIIILALSIYCFIKYVRKKQLYGKIILDETLDYSSNDMGDLEYFIGREGIVKTPLRPFGSADFNGITVEVCSLNGFISKNSHIKVVCVENQKILVTEMNKN